MGKTFMPQLKTTEELKQHQLKGLQWTVAHAYEGSSFYRQRLEEAGVHPGDIRSLDDISRLPFATADDLKAGYPFPLLAVPDSDVVRIHASSGTTGKRKILSYTQKDIASLIGISRPTLNILLNDLRTNNVIDFSRKEIKILKNIA
jgi:phenylacetate-CoA ligase